MEALMSRPARAGAVMSLVQSSLLYWIAHPVKKKRSRCRTPKAGPPMFSWQRVKDVMAGKIPGPLPEDFVGPGFVPASPTEAEPGSEEKILVLQERASLRMQLNHPRDCRVVRIPPPDAEECPDHMLNFNEECA
jgi:hypothetical protein